MGLLERGGTSGTTDDGSGTDGSLEAGEFVDGGNVDWSGLAAAFVGAVLTLFGYALASTIGLVSDGFRAVQDAMAGFVAALVATPFDGAVGVMDSAWSSFASSVAVLGPFAFPVAVATTVAVLWVILWGVTAFARRRW